MSRVMLTSRFTKYLLIMVLVFLTSASNLVAGNEDKSKGPPPVPVRIALVEQKMVSEQVSLVGSTEVVATSTVAAEVSGVVEYFPAKEGDFVKRGDLLVRLRSNERKIRLKGAVAAREMIRARLELAGKELNRYSRLKDADSIAARNYDEAFYNQRAFSQELLRSEADMERLEYEIKQTQVMAPFSGFISKEHTQVGQWINVGGSVVDLVDLGQIRVSMDVPERYVVMIAPQGEVKVRVKSISDVPRAGKINAILPQGDPDSRTFPVKINIENQDFKIKSGMEAMVTFTLAAQKSALLVPKDAVVTAGNNRLVFIVNDGKAIPVPVKILGYYDGNVEVAGKLAPGSKVVIRGNERLRPGQPVSVIK
jgi:membrane fusion protein (multidrug efflux system)